MKKILIGTPVHQDPEILKFYLSSLLELDTSNLIVHYCFIDDNIDPASKNILNTFRNNNNNVKILNSAFQDEYIKTNHTHQWNSHLIWKVANFKNQIINEVLEGNYDFLFFVDSDLILQKETLQHLISTDKDIISEIFWTKWDLNGPPLPQVWQKDTYTLYQHDPNEQLTPSDIKERTLTFLNMLKQPGVYPVGGLGALTLIKKEVLEKGVNFSEIQNISFWGEDRHFCIRAIVHGFELFVDTHYPAFHIYRKSDLTQFYI
ncbi:MULTISPECIES: hypothetical protein [Bacillus cereus group]|uniref:hypothetical protein n=1 Tax=Bacillus cereus group TaxID=86661 RepID=UPI0011C7B3A9|nr:hypothetical protein [Bacillus sp. BF9-10]TXR80516.1 hypothetical protein DN396_16315 [Bacillus sp. BF9-10]